MASGDYARLRELNGGTVHAPSLGTLVYVTVENSGGSGNFDGQGAGPTGLLTGFAEGEFHGPPGESPGGDNWTSEAVIWIGGSGSWNTASNWSTGDTPRENDDVIIDVATDELTITISSGDQNVRSVQSTETLLVTGGSLSGGPPAGPW